MSVTQQLQAPIQFGKYTLYERIGRGGMADVFKGRIQGPAGFERVFVVKRILPHLSDDPTFIRMFVDEAKLSARLNHPNIVQIFELGSVDGELFISMEHVPGHDLAQTMRALWKAGGPPRPELVAYIGREMCRALAYAHGLTNDDGQPLGMIHRDVSPSNVMLSFEGAVKLLDFGIAKALGGDVPETSKSGTLKGKYAYMAPEQTEGEDVDHRIDIFAAGIVMHELLTGRRLFKGQNDIQTIERVRRCEVPPPSEVNSATPPALDDIVLRALARDPNARFQSAGAMADAFDDIVHAAHFTPQNLAAIVRETFGFETGAASVIDRRVASSISNSSISAVTGGTGGTGSSGRSPTVPPISLPSTRPSTRMPPMPMPTGAGRDGGASDAIPAASLVRPPWRRGSFWLVALLCAGGIGLTLAKGARVDNTSGGHLAGRSAGVPGATPEGAPLTAALPFGSGANKRARHVPVLIQSEPEGADIYVTGRLESLGTTPRWVNLELEPNAPTRVMIRKAGFQDKAMAVEAEKPPTVKLIPIGIPSAASPVRDEDSANDRRLRRTARKTKSQTQTEMDGISEAAATNDENLAAELPAP